MSEGIVASLRVGFGTVLGFDEVARMSSLGTVLIVLVPFVMGFRGFVLVDVVVLRVFILLEEEGNSVRVETLTVETLLTLLEDRFKFSVSK